MRIGYVFALLCSGWMFTSGVSYGQEEGAADLFTEDYTDEFQEKFFEGLKQKGIENHDKAIVLFLECKELDKDDPVVDFELAKAYQEEGQLLAAQEYAIEALDASPENKWYLQTLMEILRKQGTTLESVRQKIPYDNAMLRENLASLYFYNGEYEKALEVAKGLTGQPFARDLTKRISDSLTSQNTQQGGNVVSEVPINENPMEVYRARLADLISAEDYGTLETAAAEAAEDFPSIPYFYYAYGLSLSRNAKPRQAVEQLESALEFLLDDIDLANNIYRELSVAYKALGDTSRANMYLSKIKTGS